MKSFYDNVPIVPPNVITSLPRRNYKKNSNLLFYYFKDIDGDTVLKVPFRFIVYESEQKFIIDTTIDLTKTKLPKSHRKKFFEYLKRVRLLEKNDIICNDYGFLVKYLALCEQYNFPLMDKVIRCCHDNNIIEIKV